MKSARQVRREAKQLYTFCLKDGRVDEDRVGMVVEKVLDSKRRGYFAVLKQFQRFLKLAYERHSAEIQSAIPLPSDLQALVQARIEGAYGSGIETQFLHEPKLIGGMRIRVGSDVYDGSVRFGLDAMEKSLGVANGRH